MRDASDRALCPICTEELSPEGELLQCPAGDYEAEKESFFERWSRYFTEANKPPPGYDALAASEDLLSDLRNMNIRKESE